MGDYYRRWLVGQAGRPLYCETRYSNQLRGSFYGLYLHYITWRSRTAEFPTVCNVFRYVAKKKRKMPIITCSQIQHFLPLNKRHKSYDSFSLLKQLFRLKWHINVSTSAVSTEATGDRKLQLSWLSLLLGNKPELSNISRGFNPISIAFNLHFHKWLYQLQKVYFVILVFARAFLETLKTST